MDNFQAYRSQANDLEIPGEYREMGALLYDLAADGGERAGLVLAEFSRMVKRINRVESRLASALQQIADTTEIDLTGF